MKKMVSFLVTLPISNWLLLGGVNALSTSDVWRWKDGMFRGQASVPLTLGAVVVAAEAFWGQQISPVNGVPTGETCVSSSVTVCASHWVTGVLAASGYFWKMLALLGNVLSVMCWEIDTSPMPWDRVLQCKCQHCWKGMWGSCQRGMFNTWNLNVSTQQHCKRHTLDSCSL